MTCHQVVFLSSGPSFTVRAGSFTVSVVAARVTTIALNAAVCIPCSSCQIAKILILQRLLLDPRSLSILDISGFCSKLLFPNSGRSDKIRRNLWLDMKPREMGVPRDWHTARETPGTDTSKVVARLPLRSRISGRILLSAISDSVSWIFSYLKGERRNMKSHLKGDVLRF
jgi:hypothetical protein